jgi:hypothetical protein
MKKRVDLDIGNFADRPCVKRGGNLTKMFMFAEESSEVDQT